MFEDDLPEEVKKRRNNDLLAVQNVNCLEDHKQRIGQTVEVLVEGLSKIGERQTGAGPRQLLGRTMTDHIVVFDGNERLTGKLVSVKIAEASPFTLYGTTVTGEVSAEELTIRDSDPSAFFPTKRFGLPIV